MKYEKRIRRLAIVAVSAFLLLSSSFAAPCAAQSPGYWADPSTLSWSGSSSWGSASWSGSHSWASIPQHGMIVSWSASPTYGPTTYNLYAAASSGAECTGAVSDPSLVATGITGTSYTVLNVPAGATAYFKVTAVQYGLASACSEEASATTP